MIHLSVILLTVLVLWMYYEHDLKYGKLDEECTRLDNNSLALRKSDKSLGGTDKLLAMGGVALTKRVKILEEEVARLSVDVLMLSDRALDDRHDKEEPIE